MIGIIILILMLFWVVIGIPLLYILLWTRKQLHNPNRDLYDWVEEEDKK